LHVFEGAPTLELRSVYSAKTILKFQFSYALEDSQLSVDIIAPQEFKLALEIFCIEFGKIHRAYEARRCAGNATIHDCWLVSLSDRYSIDAGVNSPDHVNFYLFDLLHSEKK
jgi:hypothetical protein